MAKLFFILFLVLPGFALSQATQLSLSIKLYPVQILEVNTESDLSLKILKEDECFEEIVLGQLEGLSTYSSHGFVLKIRRLGNEKAGFSDSTNTKRTVILPSHTHSVLDFERHKKHSLKPALYQDVADKPKAVSVQLLYSIEAL